MFKDNQMLISFLESFVWDNDLAKQEARFLLLPYHYLKTVPDIDPKFLNIQGLEEFGYVLNDGMYDLSYDELIEKLTELNGNWISYSVNFYKNSNCCELSENSSFKYVLNPDPKFWYTVKDKRLICEHL